GPADIADEERVAGEEHWLGIRIGGVVRPPRDVLGGVARRVDGGEPDGADLEREAIIDRDVLEVLLAEATGVNRGAGDGGQLERAGDEVGVHVGLEDRHDAPAGRRAQSTYSS